MHAFIFNERQIVILLSHQNSHTKWQNAFDMTKHVESEDDANSYLIKMNSLSF